MRIRLVIDLLYPTAKTSEEEALIKHVLSAQVLSAARMKQFDVAATDDIDAIAVDEVMVGCARVEEKAPAIGPGCIPMQVEILKKPPVNVYGDEDGDYWFATGHVEVHKMVDAVIAWESEIADPIDSRDIDMGSHKTYFVIEDPDDSERYRVVNGDSVGAQPMTSIRRA
jgi:hypothetical protein